MVWDATLPSTNKCLIKPLANVTKLCLMDFARFVILDSDLAVIEINEKTDDPSAFSKVIQKNRH